MKHFNFLVLSNPVEGREDEYNDWYDNQHLKDVLDIPGVVAAQRFRRTGAQRTKGPHPWKYVCVYECETDNIEEIISELGARSGTPQLPMSSAMAEDAMVCFFEAVTERKLR